MGDAAESMIMGDACQFCGCFFEDEGDGYPRTCDHCGGDGGETI